MDIQTRFTTNVLSLLLAVIAALSMLSQTVSAHEGEDHGEAQAPVVSSGANISTRTTRVGEYEVTLKHPSLEPDKGTGARLFVTKYETNEPVNDAQLFVMFIGNGGAPVEARGAAGSTAGVYEVSLPPLPQGSYRLVARVQINGANATADYGTVNVAPLPPSAVESSSQWARTALLALAVLVALGLGGAVVYRFLKNARASRQSGQAATV